MAETNTPMRTYWRSHESRAPAADSPPTEAQVKEFPPGAEHLPEGVDRRQMLGLMGASLGLAGLTACRRPVEHIVPYVNAPEGIVPGVPQKFATAMPLGTTSLGVVVESHEGRPTKIEGNELHPSSGGAAGPWAQAAILDLYDPDRSIRPRRRSAAETEAGAADGGEGDGHGAVPAAWEDSSWDAFASFWAEAGAGDGSGITFLSGGYCSPTRARLSRAVRERYPQARWAAWEPLHDGAVFAGLARATGTAQRPVYHLEAARVALAVDCDLFATDSDAVHNARSWAAGRRPGEAGAGEMNRLYAVESALTVTGAAADHRVRIQSRQIPAFLSAVAAGVGVPTEAGGSFDAGSLDAAVRQRAAGIAAELVAHPGAAVVAVGRSQPAAVHALAYRVNEALGAVGGPLTLHPLRDAEWGSAEALAELVQAAQDGAVETLVVLGGNPAYDAPADLDLAAALATAGTVVHLGARADETAALADWHLPESHFLEAWGDARWADGTLSVVQPLIAPLFDSKSAVEVLAMLAGDEVTGGHELVRQSWSGLGVADEPAWRRVLHDGLHPAVGEGAAEGAGEAGAADLPSEEAAAAPDSTGLELSFRPDLSVYDGRFANNGWLQELPDPLTKITWDNALLISPATAAEHAVASGDVVRVSVGGRSLEVPAFILPGQADGSLALTLGYGRRGGGRVAEGVGVSAYSLRTATALSAIGGVSLEATGGSHALSQTQEHWTLAEPITGNPRRLIQEASLEEYRHHPHFAHAKHPESKLIPEFEYDEGHQWGMVIDLGSCIGCSACVVACQSENNIPIVGKEQVALGREMHWLRVDRYFSGQSGDPSTASDDPGVAYQPVPCQHCENAPCEQVCPVAATVHDDEGLNAMVYNRCIGTRYCSNNCPYKVRRFNFFNYTKDTPELVKLAMNPDVTVRSRGVMEKCTYCIQRINQGKIGAKREARELVDGDVRTACQQTCPTQAISFGDLNAGGSQVAALKQVDRNYTLLDELHNKPRTSYLARITNPSPAWNGSGASGAAPDSEPETHS